MIKNKIKILSVNKVQGAENKFTGAPLLVLAKSMYYIELPIPS